jgi:hypothetical protein
MALVEVDWRTDVFIYNSTDHPVRVSSFGVGHTDRLIEPGSHEQIGKLAHWDWDFDVDVEATFSWPDNAYPAIKHLYPLKELWQDNHLMPYNLPSIGACKIVPNCSAWHSYWTGWLTLS